MQSSKRRVPIAFYFILDEHRLLANCSCNFHRVQTGFFTDLQTLLCRVNNGTSVCPNLKAFRSTGCLWPTFGLSALDN